MFASYVTDFWYKLEVIRFDSVLSCCDNTSTRDKLYVALLTGHSKQNNTKYAALLKMLTDKYRISQSGIEKEGLFSRPSFNDF